MIWPVCNLLIDSYLKMAVRVGFEPTEPFQARIFSKDVLSTTQPPDRLGVELPLLMRNLAGRQRFRRSERKKSWVATCLGRVRSQTGAGWNIRLLQGAPRA